jgi:hypothetical protein
MKVRASISPCFFAAHSFPGESLASCCLRECQEEIGITLKHSDLLGQLPSGRSLTGMKVTPFVAFLGDIDPARLQLSTDEISEAFCIGVDDLLDSSKVEQQDFYGQWSVPRYTGGLHPVWGLTAYVTQYFLSQASCCCRCRSPNTSSSHVCVAQVLLPASAETTSCKL